MIEFNKSYYSLIDNKITDKEPVGYCYCDAHKGYVSAAYCKSHNCLHKDKGHICTFFIQNKEHQYFIQQKQKKDDAALYKRLKSMYFGNMHPEPQANKRRCKCNIRQIMCACRVCKICKKLE